MFLKDVHSPGAYVALSKQTRVDDSAIESFERWFLKLSQRQSQKKLVQNESPARVRKEKSKREDSMERILRSMVEMNQGALIGYNQLQRFATLKREAKV